MSLCLIALIDNICSADLFLVAFPGRQFLPSFACNAALQLLQSSARRRRSQAPRHRLVSTESKSN